MRLPLLDSLRAIGALAVLLTHVAFQTGTVRPGWPTAPLARLDWGVALFFALSGFLLYRLRLPRGQSSYDNREYLRRRAVRILPAYWLALTVVLLSEPSATAADAVRYALLLQVYGGPSFADFAQTWSLCTEVAFYALLPVLAWALPSGRELRYLLALSLSCYAFIAVVLVAGLDPLLLQWLPARLDWFAVGMAVAVAHDRATRGVHDRWTDALRALGAHPGTAWFAVIALLLVASTPIGGPLGLGIPGAGTALAKQAVYAIAAGLAVTACAMADQDRGLHARILGSRWLRWLGTISYGIFLWHLLVITGVFALTGWEPFAGRMLAVGLMTLVGSIVVASLSWYLVERPLLRLERRTQHRRHHKRDQELPGSVGDGVRGRSSTPGQDQEQR